MNKYWNYKFKEKKFVWGTEESLAARIVLDDIKSSFKSYESLKLLDIGCGYGRDVNYFRNNGLDAMGIDNSGEAIILGKEQWPRKIIIDKIYGMMNKNGVAYFITSSDRDEDYMKGKAIGDHLIVNERGVMKYYFNEDSIKKEFKIFDRIEINTFSEMHTHDYLHEHINYVIKCIKQGI